MSKKRKAQLLASFFTGVCMSTEFGVAFACATSGWLLPYMALSLIFAMTFPTEGPHV